MIYLMIKISDLTPRDVDILSILRKENIEYQNEGYKYEGYHIYIKNV